MTRLSTAALKTGAPNVQFQRDRCAKVVCTYLRWQRYSHIADVKKNNDHEKI